MGISVSDYGCDLILETLLGGTFPTSLWVALSLRRVDPSWDGDDLAFFEPTDAAYGRLEIVLPTGFTDVDGGACTNVDDLVWDTPTEDWGQIGFFALCDAETSGHVLFPCDIASPFYVPAGGEAKMLAGSITLNVGSITDYGTDS